MSIINFYLLHICISNFFFNLLFFKYITNRVLRYIEKFKIYIDDKFMIIIFYIKEIYPTFWYVGLNINNNYFVETTFAISPDFSFLR